MKKIDGINYYSVEDISKRLENEKFDVERVKKDFDEGTIEGKKIDGEWHATVEAFGAYTNVIEDEIVKFTERKELDLTDIKLKGRVLDIGGGGEGTIGQLLGENVVAIDMRESEFEESRESGDTESLKIIMDAKDMKFLDKTFDAATVFFTFLYIPKDNRSKVFEEIERVLKPEGEVLIWDLKIPDKTKGETRGLYGIKLEIDIGSKTIETGYGTRWVPQDAKYYIDLAEEIGLRLQDKKVGKDIFYLRFQK